MIDALGVLGGCLFFISGVLIFGARGREAAAPLVELTSRRRALTRAEAARECEFDAREAQTAEQVEAVR